MTEHNNPQDNITVSRELLQQILSFVEEGNPGHIADKINVLVKLHTALKQLTPVQETVAWRIRCTDPLRDWVLMYRYPKEQEQFSNVEIQPLGVLQAQEKSNERP